MKTLILGTCYISEAQEGAQNYNARVVEMWCALAEKLNPGTDILLVDSHSPANIDNVLWGRNPKRFQRVIALITEDNIGHLNRSGRDGWGRSFTIGAQYAIDQNYDWLVYIDADIIFTKPVRPILDNLQKHGIAAACPWDKFYDFPENGLMFLSVPYLRDTKFLERYDWPSRKPTTSVLTAPEHIFERLLGDDLFILPWRGGRNDNDRVTVNNLAVIESQTPLTYLTHCTDLKVYERLLEMKGIRLD